jgi:hypothetical protein
MCRVTAYYRSIAGFPENNALYPAEIIKTEKEEQKEEENRKRRIGTKASEPNPDSPRKSADNA